MNSFNKLFRLFWRHSAGPDVAPSDVILKELVDGGIVFSMCLIVSVPQPSVMAFAPGFRR
jgi:hypothetical protein